MTETQSTQPASRTARFLALALTGATVLAACGGAAAAPPDAGAGSGTNAPGSASGVILPVTDNPITNASTVEAFGIDSVLVENNVDASGADTSDHLEVLVSNTGAADLSGFEVFYTFTESTTGTAESYYTKLPDTFTVPAGGQRIIHFDNSGTVDHFAVNDFSLYATSAEALDVTVIVSAVDASPQTMTVQKDAGGAEVAD